MEESSNTQRTPYLFTSKELDEETGLYYFGARYYDPRTSVWQSADPILGSYLGGSPNGGVYKSINTNLFRYAALNPLKYVDPDGNAELEDGAQLGAGDWHKKDRVSNSATWQAANVHNLQQAGGAKEYSTIGQRAAFYGWFQGATDKQGFGTKWAGAAAKVSLAAESLGSYIFAGSDLKNFANKGNKMIFDDMFPKLKSLHNGPALTGAAAQSWDESNLAHEQRLVAPLYDEARSGGYLGRLQSLASQTGVEGSLGGMYGGATGVGLPPFRGDISDVSARWSYGMKNMGYGDKLSDPTRMPK